MSKFWNECLECGYEGTNAIWLIDEYEGMLHYYEKELVDVEPKTLLTPEPDSFDLDCISAQRLMDKYKIDKDRAEKLILDGQPICPKCHSKLYVKKEI